MSTSHKEALFRIDLREEAIFYAVTEGKFIKPRIDINHLDEFVTSVFHMAKYLKDFLEYYDSCAGLVKWAKDVLNCPLNIVTTPIHLDYQTMTFVENLQESDHCLYGSDAVVFRRLAELINYKYNKTKKPYRYENTAWYTRFEAWKNLNKHLIEATDRNKMKEEFLIVSLKTKKLDSRISDACLYTFNDKCLGKHGCRFIVKNILSTLSRKIKNKSLKYSVTDILLEPVVQHISDETDTCECFSFYIINKTKRFESFVAFDMIFMYQVSYDGCNRQYSKIVIQPLDRRYLDDVNKCITKQVLLAMYKYIQEYGSEPGKISLPREVVYM